MPGQRRRRSDADEPIGSLRQIPHYVAYPVIGTFFGLCSPVGAFLMRFWMADPILKQLWFRNELQYNFMFYAYMGFGTVFAFMVFGYILGLRSEKQRIKNRILGARVEELHLKSVTDSLTGTYTHGYLHEILELEIQDTLTQNRPLSVLILDIDDFKRINDTHGHLFGDRVIKETAETILGTVRSEDIVGRLGGDEFLVIMPQADADTASQVARRICADIASRGNMATVSIGASTFEGGSQEGAKELLRRADANLYHAKHEGKNRVSASPNITRIPHRGSERHFPPH